MSAQENTMRQRLSAERFRPLRASAAATLSRSAPYMPSLIWRSTLLRTESCRSWCAPAPAERFCFTEAVMRCSAILRSSKSKGFVM